MLTPEMNLQELKFAVKVLVIFLTAEDEKDEPSKRQTLIN
jgi:hypothetical protein